MMSNLRPALVLLSLFVALTGLAYPLSVTGIAQIAMPRTANGSLVERNGKVIGSELIGQNFADAKFFHARPSATSAADPADSNKTIDAPYNASNSSGSNLGPTAQKLVDRVKGDIDSLRADGVQGSVPADGVTTSASGLDPHISPENALSQVSRVAKARGMEKQKIQKLVLESIEGRSLGVFGEPRVNVLALNLALEAKEP
ncbi:MAG: potassium-transporting ATPase subunit KdpC [Afipia sp.]|nr:potassium-transporting ATPase subunit KdpC [Afipia sp.]